MAWKYKAPNGETITIKDENLKSIMEREKFELIGEVDDKGKVVKKAAAAEESGEEK